jgi:hypothetical protein
MDIDGEKLEQTVFALLYLTSFQEGPGRRAWKGLPWTVMDALHEKGYISNPATTSTTSIPGFIGRNFPNFTCA